MSSLPTVLTVGSVSSQTSFIASYQRAQAGLTNSGLPSDISGECYQDEDEEAFIGFEDSDDFPTPRPRTLRRDNFLSDGDFTDSQVSPTDTACTSYPSSPISQKGFPIPKTDTRQTNERTPLLHKSLSATFPDRPPLRHSRNADKPADEDCSDRLDVPTGGRTEALIASDDRPHPPAHHGQSTFGQTLFNSIAILLGIGMLSEPLAFAYSGWLCGTLLIISYGFITCHTAKVLARVVLSDSRVRSYSDIGRKAFGPKSMPFISFMFCLELFSVSVILVTLYADSLHTIIPTYSPDTYKFLGLLLLIPTVFLPLSVLSLTSILGIVCTIFLVVVIFIDGISKHDAPGSLWSPAQTNFSPMGVGEVGMAFGLFMAGFSGHAVIPSLARDMADPTQFDAVMNYAFASATFVYAVIGAAGYMMFGNSVSDEVSRNLLGVAGYSPTLNKIALWILVLSPLSKYALSSRPLHVTLEILLGIDTTGVSSDPHGSVPSNSDNKHHSHHHHHNSHPTSKNLFLKQIFTVILRVSFVILSVFTSILVPEFSSMMAILGSICAFVLCVVGPISAKVAMEGGWRKSGWVDRALLFGGLVMAVWGTASALWSTTEEV